MNAIQPVSERAESRDIIPPSVSAALAALEAMEREVASANTFQEIRRFMDFAKAAKILYPEVRQVREQADRAIVLAEYRIGEELNKAPVSVGGRPAGNRRSENGGFASMAEQVGSQTRGLLLKKLADHPVTVVKQAMAALHEKGKDATRTAVLKFLAGEETKERREKSRAAVPLEDGMDWRIGDCRHVLADIPDNSVPLILTDPPYGDEAEPLYEWLAQFASRVLIPGGSLICYTGQSRLNRDMAILEERLRYWWLLVMPHHQSQRLPGKFVIANFKPVLWYVKEFRRGRSLVPDFLISPKRDKSEHDWSQGDGGVGPLIEHLTEPGELIVDPFAGTANWGRRALAMGRRWIGADVVTGGDALVAAE